MEKSRQKETKPTTLQLRAAEFRESNARITTIIVSRKANVGVEPNKFHFNSTHTVTVIYSNICALYKGPHSTSKYGLSSWHFHSHANLKSANKACLYFHLIFSFSFSKFLNTSFCANELVELFRCGFRAVTERKTNY